MLTKNSSLETAGMCSSRLSRINDFMKEVTDSGDLVGVSSMVAHHGEIVHFEQFGLKDRETKEPMQADTLFRLYSMTKPIVCTAFMTLYEQGKFDLEDPVSNFIPAFADLKVLEHDAKGHEILVDLQQPVTIHHLLTHTSGLVYDFYAASSVCNLYRQNQICANPNRSLKEFVDELCQLPLAFQPGTRWFYSVSIDVIGYLIEVISGKSLACFLQDVIFNPLEMKDIGFFIPKEKRHRMAAMYGGVDLCEPGVAWTQLMDVWEKGIQDCLDVSKSDPVDKSEYARGGTGLKSTAMDYMIFLQMLLNQGELNGVRILGRKTVEFMHANHVDLSLLPLRFETIQLPGLGFGLGSRVLLDSAKSGLISSEGEFGWGGAAKTYYWVDPKEDIIGLFLTQSMMDFSNIERRFQTLVYQAIVD